jgi:hypothetical protein
MILYKYIKIIFIVFVVLGFINCSKKADEIPKPNPVVVPKADNTSKICNNHLYDIFESANPCEGQTGDIYWNDSFQLPQAGRRAYKGGYWSNTKVNNGFIATPLRGNSQLKYTVTQPYGSYESFTLSFGYYTNSAIKKGYYTLDLSKNASIYFEITNNGDSIVNLQLFVEDINGAQLYFDKSVVNDKSKIYNYQIGIGADKSLKPKFKTVVSYDLKNAVTATYDAICRPCVDDDNLKFDYSQVKTLYFTLINHHDNPLDSYKAYKLEEYPITIEKFSLGDIFTCNGPLSR